MSKDTLQLPKTAFSMKANLPNKEPAILESWEKNKIFEKIRKDSKGKEKFILHDGPPYRCITGSPTNLGPSGGRNGFSEEARTRGFASLTLVRFAFVRYC